MNIDNRRKITKLRVGCSKLDVHSFNFNGSGCKFCDMKESETLEHYILKCPKYGDLRDDFQKQTEIYCKEFKNYTRQTKLCSILSQTLYGYHENTMNYQNLCVKYITVLVNRRNQEMVTT